MLSNKLLKTNKTKIKEA